MAERIRVTHLGLQLGHQESAPEPGYRIRVTQLYLSLDAPEAQPEETAAIITYAVVVVPDGGGLGLRDFRPAAKWSIPKRRITVAPRPAG